MNILSLNFTNAIPKRVRLICGSLQDKHQVTQLCWSRIEGVVDTSNVNIQARNSTFFIFKVIIYLWKNKSDALFFDDLRFAPALLVPKLVRGTKLIYNRQEIPCVSLALRLHNATKLPHRLSNKIAVWIESLIGKMSDAVVTIPVNAQQMSLLNSWHCPIMVLSNYPEKNSIREIEADPVNFSMYRLIYSGGIKPETGLFHYLELMKRLNETEYHGKITLILVGHLWKSNKQALDDLIADYGCTEKVDYRQWVPYNELQSLYISSDIALAYADPNHPKYSQMLSGCSRKIFTYMSAGLPILAGGAFSSIVEEERAGLCSNYADVDTLLSNTLMLLKDSHLRKSLGMSGIRIIRDKYNWENYEASIQSFFDDIAGKKPQLEVNQDV